MNEIPFQEKKRLEAFIQENPSFENQKLRLDYFIDPRLLIVQDKKHFCFNADSASLAQFVKIKPGQSVLEIGPNNGAILAYLARFSPGFLCGVEILQEPAKLASFNMERVVSPLQIPWQIVQSAIQDFNPNPKTKEQEENESLEVLFQQSPSPLPKKPTPIDLQESKKEIFAPFDVVVCNPPYFNLESSRHHETLSLRQLARFEQNLDLETMIQQAARLLKEYGRFFFVHRPNRLAQSIVALEKNGFALARLQIIYDKRDEQAKAFLIEAIKGGHCEVQLLPALFRGEEKELKNS